MSFDYLSLLKLAYSQILSLLVFGVLFWILAQLVYQFNKNRPERQSKNFTLVDKIGILNTDSKCELFYPFIKIFITTPLYVACFEYVRIFLSPELTLGIFENHLNQLPFLIQLFIALFVLDMCLYVRHRFTHEFMWSFHAVHHCAHKISWLTMMRVHPIDAIIMGMIQTIILHFIGASSAVFITAFSINGLWNAFVHSNIHLDWPKPFKYIFGSPNFHRWHHATDTEAHNTNYCIMFSCIDYVMGTYYCPDNRLPETYGSSMKTLDNHESTNILKELYYPIGRQFKKINKLFKGI